MENEVLTLLRALHTDLLPVTDKLGFKSIHPRRCDDPEGRNCILYPLYRVIRKVCIHTLDVQYDRCTGYFCVNMGIHFRFLPLTSTDELPNLRKIETSHCVFRTRLSPKPFGDHWWPVCSSDAETRAQVKDCAATLEGSGMHYFMEYGVLPGPYGDITVVQRAHGFLVPPDVGGCPDREG